MKFFFIALFFLLPLTAQAKMQFMTCQTSGRIADVIEVNIDREVGVVGAVGIKNIRKKNDEVVAVYTIDAQEISYINTSNGFRLKSDWKNDFNMSFDNMKMDNPDVRFETQNGIEYDGNMKCTFVDESKDEMTGRELCLIYYNFCVQHRDKYGVFPEVRQQAEFKAEADEVNKREPEISVRRLISCERKVGDMTYLVRGTAGSRPNSYSLTYGPFLITAHVNDDELYQYFARSRIDGDILPDVTLWKTNKDDDFRMEYRVGEAFVGFVSATKILNYEGFFNCSEQIKSAKYIAEIENCFKYYLACRKFEETYDRLPRFEDLEEVKSIQRRVREVAFKETQPDVKNETEGSKSIGDEIARRCVERSTSLSGWIRTDYLDLGKKKHSNKFATKMIITYKNACDRDINVEVHCAIDRSFLGKTTIPAKPGKRVQNINIQDCLRQTVNKTGNSIVQLYSIYAPK